MSSFLSRAAIAAALFAATPAAAQQAAGGPNARGEYLSRIMDCGGCHTGGALTGQPDPRLNLAGSQVGFAVPGLGVFYPPNLTPDRETGLGGWSEAEIIRAVRTGVRPDGRVLAPVMPWHSYAALNDADARALARYLRSLPPVRNETPRMIGAGETPTAPYLTVVVPGR
ncbi:cytochrome c [Roseomonas eburnea]|uniref:Cytochrome c n=1 Tax=Neoroseomonas eburnea TaxID=1346889 RepID=A0A9X9XBX2_9PROT|nr:cytochrome c [Neoroseomonas eburnea]MBR0681208.1 cytochrome c [Neoroseomonas eburnea]